MGSRSHASFTSSDMSSAASRRVALVTGSTSGIGLGVAHRLARAGYDLVINGFGDASAISGAKESLAAHGVRVSYDGADLSDPGECRRLVSSAVETYGRLDVLVNNAGIQHTSPIESFPDAMWDKIIAIMLSAPFHLTKAALPGMQERGWGRIVNISSVHGLVASREKAAYVSAKHGLIGLTKVTALDNADKGVTANAICPGWVKTPLVAAQIEDRARKNGTSVEQETEALVGEKQPLKRFTTPEQIGDMVVFLCSDSGSSMTGSTITMDGGWTAQ